MGERGPVPKRSSQRRRRNKPDVDTGTPDITRAESGTPTPPEAPAADEGWHPIAARLYESLTESGQRQWYEPSDWAAAYLMCESISRDLSEQVVGVTDDGDVVRAEIPLKGASLAAYLKAFAGLGVTEGDRRRARMELTRATVRDVDEDAAVVALDDWTARYTPPEETG